MRIVHVSKTDRGGGLIAIDRLHRGLLEEGHDSQLFVAESLSGEPDPTVRTFVPPTDKMSRVRRRIRRIPIERDRRRYLSSRPAHADYLTDDRCEHGRDVLDQIPPCDVVTIHLMDDLLDYRAALGALARRTPIVRVLHTMAFFTGGCHYDRGCGKFVDRCGACPLLGSKDPQDLSRQVWLRKRAAFTAMPRDRLWVVAPSRWIAGEIKRSSLGAEFPVTVIPHGVDTALFRPRDRRVARDVLGIPADACVVLFLAEWMYRPTKGFAVLAEALQGMADAPNLMLVSVGTGRPAIDVQIAHLKLPPVRGERFLSFVYSAADVFVVPSLQENFPLVVLEAMACGVPVVGSDVGGIREQIRPGVTGLLVPAKDPVALRDAIHQLAKDPAMRAEMSAQATRVVSEEYTLGQHVRRYIELYGGILSGRTSEIAAANARVP